MRREIFDKAGGYPDVAYEDWALWRRIARAGGTFKASGRPHFLYRTHGRARSQTQLLHGRFDEHWQEMKDSEA